MFHTFTITVDSLYILYLTGSQLLNSFYKNLILRFTLCAVKFYGFWQMHHICMQYQYDRIPVCFIYSAPCPPTDDMCCTCHLWFFPEYHINGSIPSCQLTAFLSEKCIQVHLCFCPLSLVAKVAVPQCFEINLWDILATASFGSYK